MYCKVICGTLVAIKGVLIDVEVDISEGFPMLNIVGMPSHTINEAKERVRTGIKNIGYRFPYKRITINLAPAHIRKEGVAFDLAIAIGILCCEKVIPVDKIRDTLILGELALNGSIRPVKGVLSLVDIAKKSGLKKCIIPYDNLQEAKLIQGIDIIPVVHLEHVVNLLKTGFDKHINELCEKHTNVLEVVEENGRVDKEQKIDFAQVVGQKKAKRGLEICVSGMHHAMLIGPPGIGKTMLAKRIPTILPPLTDEEMLELTKIYSAAEKLLSSEQIIKSRPFRDPHHSITRASFIGGGIQGKPGEISLAHCGVLMLDEFPEFKRDVIESLREPLEQGSILLSRNQNIYSFPADFILVAAMNPCPCGYFPNPSKCRCLPSDIKRYQNKLSGPILDRIDLFIEMNPTSYDQFQLLTEEEPSTTILDRVMKAHKIQQERYKKHNISFNSQLNVDQIKSYCVLEKDAKAILETAYKTLELSSRSYHRLLRVARTIADLDFKEKIESKHIAEAIMFRQLENSSNNGYNSIVK